MDNKALNNNQKYLGEFSTNNSRILILNSISTLDLIAEEGILRLEDEWVKQP